MALRGINTNRSKMGDENALGKELTKAKLEPAKRGPLGEISNKPALLRCTGVGKTSTGVNLKDVKAKVVTRHALHSVNSWPTIRAKHAKDKSSASYNSMHPDPFKPKQSHPQCFCPAAGTGNAAIQPRPQLRKATTMVALNANPAGGTHTTVSTSSNLSMKDTIYANSKGSVETVEHMDVAAFSSTTLPQNVENMDKDDDPVVLSEYVADIYKYLRELEIQYPVKLGYLSEQKVTERMRAVLIDWMVDVHQQFHLLQETLYLTVANVDRFLQAYRTIDRSHLQLAGMTCMWVACKYEEMYCPEVGDFVYIADNTYTKTQIVQMECKILQTLNFNLGRPLPIHFLRRFSKAAHSDPTTHTLAKYFLELSLVEYEMCHVPPSMLAAAAIFVALWLVGGETCMVWNPTLEYYSEYKLDDILPIASKMAGYIVKAPTAKYQATRRKFSASKLLKISAHPKLQSPRLASIAKSLANF